MKRSKHSLTNYKLLSCKMGQLIPIDWYEVLPGDTIQQSTSVLVRAAPMVTPAMHPCHIRVHHFFVPNRIVWNFGDPDNWESFITGGSDGNNAAVHPYLDFGGTAPAVGTLSDYLGVPVSGVVGRVNAFPYRAYARVWNEYFRDEDLQTAVNLLTSGGADGTTNQALLNCAWEKDYLTSARPWEVKGPSVTVPLGTTAPVIGIGAAGTLGSITTQAVRETSGSTPTYSNTQRTSAGSAGNDFYIKVDSAIGASAKPQIFADLSNASAVTINTLRHALAVQRFEEARARYGSRYTEYLRYLGVRSSDGRLQRPEYLGGGRSTLQISEVLNTTATNPATMYGHGISAMRSNRFRRFFEEHGIVMTVMSVRPRTMYSNRLPRKLARSMQAGYTSQLGTKEDYWQRELQHIGQQKIDGSEADIRAVNSIFGYQDRYDEYRREESSVHGLFRTTLDTWHLSREFGSTPALNSTFVSCVPSTRIFADTSNDNLYVMAHHSIQARRLVSREGNSLTF
jgi:Capsid protein (F protein)